MAEILEIFPFGQDATKYLRDKEDEHYQKTVKPVIDGIKDHISPDLKRQDILNLSVVRRFNSRLLRELMDSDLIEWSKNEYELEDQLLRTYLVTRKSGFLEDDITRRLLSIHLRKTEPELFLKYM